MNIIWSFEMRSPVQSLIFWEIIFFSALNLVERMYKHMMFIQNGIELCITVASIAIEVKINLFHALKLNWMRIFSF